MIVLTVELSVYIPSNAGNIKWSRWDCSPLFEGNRRNPLNSRAYCHLLVSPMSVGDPFRPFGHPHIGTIWQQLATVAATVATVPTNNRSRASPPSKKEATHT